MSMSLALSAMSLAVSPACKTEAQEEKVARDRRAKARAEQRMKEGGSDIVLEMDLGAVLQQQLHHGRAR